MVLISSTTETRERRGEGVVAESRSIADGVGMGNLKMRNDHKRVVYAARTGVKTSMVGTTQGFTMDERQRIRQFEVPKYVDWSRSSGGRRRRILRAEIMVVMRKKRSGEWSHFYTPLLR